MLFFLLPPFSSTGGGVVGFVSQVSELLFFFVLFKADHFLGSEPLCLPVGVGPVQSERCWAPVGAERKQRPRHTRCLPSPVPHGASQHRCPHQWPALSSAVRTGPWSPSWHQDQPQHWAGLIACARVMAPGMYCLLVLWILPVILFCSFYLYDDISYLYMHGEDIFISVLAFKSLSCNFKI